MSITITRLTNSIFTSDLQCSEVNTMPMQETSQEDDRELIRRKRLERLVSGGADNPDSPKSESSQKPMLRSVSIPPNSSVLSEVMKPDSRELISNSPPVQSFKRSSSSPKMRQFEVGDLVKVEGAKKTLYGVLKWIGSIPGVEGTLAGIEMVWIWSIYINCSWKYIVCVNFNTRPHVRSVIVLCRKRKLRVDTQERFLVGSAISHVRMVMGYISLLPN